MSEETQVNVPEELEDILLEFTVNVLVDKPDDIVSYAASYFNRLKHQQEGKDINSEEFMDDIADSGSMRSISEILGNRDKRRETVIGESIDPEAKEPSDIEVYPKSMEEIERIKERTKDIFLFKHLSEHDLNAIINAMRPTEVKEGQIIIRQGEEGDFFYVIERGCFDASIAQDGGPEKFVKSYKNSGSFGELALLHNQPRAATVKATTDGMVWAVSRSTFTKLVVKNAYKKRKKYMELLDFVKELKPLKEHEKMQVCDALTTVLMEEGDILFHEGDNGNGMYFIESGTVCIFKESNSDSKVDVLAELKEGDYFGELALVKKQPRAGTAKALEKTQLAFLDVDAFERLLGPCMEIMKRKMDEYEEPK